MTELSPAIAAAALRAAADQGEALFDEYDNVACAVRVDCLLDIAAELEPQS